MDICFATNNPHKTKEVRQLLSDRFRVLNLSDIGCRKELPETQDNLAGNSEEKATYVYRHYQTNCFADDTGLEVDALQGEPGVHSAHYAGPQRNSEDNMRLLLQKLTQVPLEQRGAQFRTVITLWLDEQMHQFEGTVRGHITQERAGAQGFGYDPIFVPEGHTRTFAEVSTVEKNGMSHRGRALQKLITFLNHHA